MPDLAPELQEEIRHAVRRYLAARPRAACSLDMIQHGLRLKGIHAVEEDLENELAYWTDLTPPQVKIIRAPHSSAKTWQITPEGRLAHDRGE